MTPRQLSFLTKAFHRKQEREHYLTALLASVTANYSMRAPQEALCPADFMPAEKERELTDEELALKMQNEFANKSRLHR